MSRSTVQVAYTPNPPTEPLLVIEENRFAHAAVERLLKSTKDAASRLVFLSGPSGVGKTHLAGFFARELRRSDPHSRVAHITADGFADEFAAAADDGSIPEFQQSYGGVDVLICEDLHALGRRVEAQRQFVAILDDVLTTRGRVMLTSRYLPGELKPMSPRLINRCRAGVTAVIRLPGRTSRENLLRHFATTRQIPIPGDVSRLFADSIAVSPRELLAAITRLDAESRLASRPIDLGFAKDWLAREAETPRIRLKEIARVVAKHFGISVRAIRSNTRRQENRLPRQCAMFLAREFTDESLASIAAYFGRKNHSTVTHTCRRIREILADDPALRQRMVRIRQALGVPEA